MLRNRFAFQDFPVHQFLRCSFSSAGLYDGFRISKSVFTHMLQHSAHQNSLSHHRNASLCSYSVHCPLMQSRQALPISRSIFSDAGQFSKSSLERSRNVDSFAVANLQGAISQKVHLLTLLSTFSSPQYLSHGFCLHCFMLQFEPEVDALVIATALVKMYGKCSSLEDARWVFDTTSNQNVFLWTAIITAYAKQSLVKEAVDLFKSMIDVKVMPDAISLANILDACRSCDTINIDSLCGQVERAGLGLDFDVGRALLNLHAARGNIAAARKLFHELPKHKRITWNIMISLYSRLGLTKESLQLYNDMQQEGLIPDAITSVAILQAFCCEAFLFHIRQMHVHILAAQLASNRIVLTTLMVGYGKCKSAEDMLGLWESIESKNVVVWGSYIAMLTKLHLGQRALDYSSRMLEEGVLPNEVTYTSSIEACTLERRLTKGKQLHACLGGSEAFSNASLVTALIILYNTCSRLDEVRRIFDVAKHRDVIFWTAAISAHIFHNYVCIAAQLFYQMQEEGILPNLVTYTSVLEVCSTLLSLAFIKQVHACIGSRDVSANLDLGTALVNTYGKCGCVVQARSVFNAMVVKDRLSWTAIVSAYARNGEEKEAFHTFQSMIRHGVVPDGVTFLSILSSCAHSGLLDLGIGLFCRMKDEFGVEPSARHYDCVTDLLGRSGQVFVAEQVLNHMPTMPSEISWTSVLAACRENADVDLGKRMSRHIFNMERQYAAPYVTLANLLAAAASSKCKAT